MRNLLFLCMFLFSSVISAQVNIDKISKADYNYLLSSQLYVILRDQDLKNRDVFETVVKEAWSLTPVSVISYDEYTKIVDQKNSVFFAVRGYNNSIRANRDKFDYVGKKVTSSHVCIDMWRNLPEDGSDKLDQTIYAKIHIGTYGEMDRALVNLTFMEKNNAMIFEFLSQNESAGITEWKPGFVKNYLQRLNYLLKKKAEVSYLKKMIDKAVMGNVKKDTLYIDSDLLFGFKGSSETALKNYGHPYRIVSKNEINDKIMNGDKFYYMIHYENLEFESKMFMTLTRVKEIVIINSLNGKCSYNSARLDQRSDGYLEENFFKKLAAYAK